MCGITGFIDLKAQNKGTLLQEIVSNMTSSLLHRGPDDFGTWVDEARGVALGHRRLAVLDLSPTGHQPMTDPQGRYVIVYNGEVYNFPTLKQELQQQGQIFRGTSDTEVILSAITSWGIKAALQKFIGMFAFALWDRAEQTLTLARDRMGEKPLYYGLQGQAFLFASELKALGRYPSFRPAVDRNALAMLLRHNYIAAPYSIYEGIYKLPAGSYLELKPASLQRGELPPPVLYWSLREIAEQGQKKQVSGSLAAAVDELARLLGEAVASQMIADVPLGAFLSGGLDSSTVVALMQAQSHRPVKTFTIGFPEQEYNEAIYAAAVARHLGTDHTELYVTAQEAQNVIPGLAALYDEPFADSSQIPTFLLCKLARQEVTVALSGDGGDELFGGYPWYGLAPRYWQKINPVPPPLRKLGHYLLSCCKFRDGKITKLRDFLGADGPEDLYYWLVSHWKQPAALVLGAREYPDQVTEKSLWPQLTSFLDRMMYFDMGMYLSNDILVKVDRAAMGVSLETRMPLLDHRLLEFAWRLPLSWKFNSGQGKWLLRNLLYRYVPKELVDRPKMGFCVPITNWLRGSLRPWAESLLEESRLRREGFFDPAPIRSKWDETMSGSDNWLHHLWSVLMFQSWLESQQTMIS